MLLIVGPERTTAPDRDWQVRDLELIEPVEWLAEDDEPRIYWAAALFMPAVEALMQFQRERLRLGLPSIEGDVMQ